jgi:2-polyprenyl-3-methyl-5-hydroxy-6-metoxy-1,4-benzoquinol methylase
VDRWQGVEGTFEVLICDRCGAGVTTPQLHESELHKFYPADYSPYVPAAGVANTINDAIVRRVQATKPFSIFTDGRMGRLVDVGCGRADLSTALVKRGWKVTGIDPSPEACAVAGSRGLDARQGTLSSVELEQDSYDGAIFQHSLEHLSYPVEELSTVSGAISADGHVAIIVPNFGSWQRKRFGSKWFHLDLPRHRVHFTAAALASALERAGFVDIETGTKTSAVGLPGTLQYALTGKCMFPGGLSLKIATALAYLTMPLSMAFNAFGGGGDFLWAVARKD